MRNSAIFLPMRHMASLRQFRVAGLPAELHFLAAVEKHPVRDERDDAGTAVDDDRRMGQAGDALARGDPLPTRVVHAQ